MHVFALIVAEIVFAANCFKLVPLGIRVLFGIVVIPRVRVVIGIPDIPVRRAHRIGVLRGIYRVVIDCKRSVAVGFYGYEIGVLAVLQNGELKRLCAFARALGNGYFRI